MLQPLQISLTGPNVNKLLKIDINYNANTFNVIGEEGQGLRMLDEQVPTPCGIRLKGEYFQEIIHGGLGQFLLFLNRCYQDCGLERNINLTHLLARMRAL
jgi:hypothetical protein